jgi:hypothetical protein
MAYIGREPQIGNFQVCDAISVVNGQAAYTMQVGGANVSPETANHMIVSLNGIIQAPGTSYTVAGSTITFASNLATGDVINFIHILGSVLDLGVPSDGTVTAAKVANDLISGKTALATAPADTDEFLVSDAGTLKRVDYSLIKSGGVALLNTTSVSSGSSSISIDGHFTTDYKTYIFEYYDFEMTSGASGEPRLRFNFSGSAYTTANYRSISGGTQTASDGNGADTNFAAWNTNYISMNTGYNYPEDGDAGAVGRIYLYNPLSTSNYKTAEGTASYLSASNVVVSHFAGTLVANSGTACSGITLYPNAGTFAAGTIRLLGVK